MLAFDDLCFILSKHIELKFVTFLDMSGFTFVFIFDLNQIRMPIQRENFSILLIDLPKILIMNTFFE